MAGTRPQHCSPVTSLAEHLAGARWRLSCRTIGRVAGTQGARRLLRKQSQQPLLLHAHWTAWLASCRRNVGPWMGVMCCCARTPPGIATNYGRCHGLVLARDGRRVVGHLRAIESRSVTRTILNFVLFFVLLTSGALSQAQGCAPCKSNAAQAGPQVQRGLRRGIAVLLIP